MAANAARAVAVGRGDGANRGVGTGRLTEGGENLEEFSEVSCFYSI